MNRREFLRCAATLAGPAILVPSAVTYFLPPRGGWPLHPWWWNFASKPVSLGPEQIEAMLEAMRRQFLWPLVDQAAADLLTYGAGGMHIGQEGVRVIPPADMPVEALLAVGFTP